MDDTFRQMVIEKLNRGEELPAEWARELFPPEKREYELVYYGKEREEDIIADTMGVPLQPASTFGRNGDDDAWHNMLIFGDNLQVLKTLLEYKKTGKLTNADGTPGVRLIYIDPPFATRQEFRGNQEQKAYQDKVTGARFVEFLRQRLVLLRELLGDDGSIYVHLDYKKVHYMKVIMDELLGENNAAEIIRRTVAAHNDPGTIGNIHDTILFYRISKQSYFSPPKDFSDLDNKLDYDKVDLPSSSDLLNARNVNVSVEGHVVDDPSKCLILKDRRNRPHLRIPSRVLNQIPISQAEVNVLIRANGKTVVHDVLPVWSNGGNTTAKTLKGGGYEYSWKGITRIWKYKKERIEEFEAKNELWYTSEGIPRKKVYYKGKNIQSIWDDNIFWNLQGIASEHTGYPTQKPEALLERILNTSSQEGDIVLDAFAGSGTTLAVAEKLGRRWIGIDCGKLAIYTIQKRMLNLKSEIGNKGKAHKPKPFTLYNAGLYDFSKLRQLPREEWRFFALNLFGCKDKSHTIGGLKLDGKRQGYSVLVFNHHENPGKRIDEETVQDIHAAVGKKIARKFFIIAPRAVFDFQQDYIDLDGVRYYALRIPYSIISELHHRDFTALQQPNDENAVNETVDAVGFDFIQPPHVEWTVSAKKRKGQMFTEACLKIKRFESRARLRGKDTRGGLETLSLLMLDLDYDGEVFDFDMVFFAQQLEADDWQAWFPLENIGEKVMAVFVDIYGNEAREVIPSEQFGIKRKPPVPKTKKRARR